MLILQSCRMFGTGAEAVCKPWRSRLQDITNIFGHALRLLGYVLQVCDLETTLTIERARAEEAELAAIKAERRLQQAMRDAR